MLFLDEFQAVQRIGENRGRGKATVIKEQMRAAFQRSRDVSFLFAGSLEHMMRDLHADEAALASPGSRPRPMSAAVRGGRSRPPRRA